LNKGAGLGEFLIYYSEVSNKRGVLISCNTTNVRKSFKKIEKRVAFLLKFFIFGDTAPNWGIALFSAVCKPH
jgi:hypothetical protein